MSFLFAPTTSYEDFFNTAFEPKVLANVFDEKFQFSPSKGVDRINGYQYSQASEAQLGVASEKILVGSFRFSPYLERLRPKGRKKLPRIIGIPTIRDRVVINQLKECLAYAFPECVPRNIANAYIRNFAEELPRMDPSSTFVCGCDIKDFYGSIDRKRLLKFVASRVRHEQTNILLHRCLATPIVPAGASRSSYRQFFLSKGVHQGLAVSNLLAAIYLKDVDELMVKLPVTYMRYVDDVLMHGSEENVRGAHRSLKTSMSRRGLDMHDLDSGKSHISRVTGSFGYLGYWFDNRKVTVRATSIERLLQSIAAQFSDFSHNHERRLKKFKYLTKDRAKEIFVMEINERITGAVCEAKRYGWVAYFSQITDLSLLHRLDSAVSGMFGRLKEFEGKPPKNLKRFARAFYEMKFRPAGGYVRDYDKITERAQKLAFLEERGRIDPKQPLTDEQINRTYAAYVRRSLAKMQADEGMMY